MDSESTKDGQNNPAPPIDVAELKTFSDPNSAELAKTSLEARGIECWLTADDCGGMLAAMDTVRGVKLFVRLTDFDAAKALLLSETVAGGQPLLDEPASSATQAKGSSPRIKLSLPQLISGVVVGVLLCLLYQWTDKFGTKTYRYDLNHDGKPDEIWIYRNGRCVEVSYDRNFDGKLDYWFDYDSAGKRLLSKADDNFDGVPDVTWRYSNGMLASGEEDTDFNGTPDVTYFYADDIVKQAVWRPNGTNVVTLRQFFRHGVLTEESRDTDGDGTFDVTIYYDAFQTITTPFKLRSVPIHSNLFYPLHLPKLPAN